MNKSKHEFKETLAQLLRLSIEEGANLIKPEYEQELYLEIEKEKLDSFISSFCQEVFLRPLLHIVGMSEI